MMYIRFRLSLRNLEDLLFERGSDLCHETVRLWWNRFGPMFAADIRRQRVGRMRGLGSFRIALRTVETSSHRTDSTATFALMSWALFLLFPVAEQARESRRG